MTAPRRKCPFCGGRATWADPVWACAGCGRSIGVEQGGPRFGPPEEKQPKPPYTLATCSFTEFRDDMGLGVRISNGSPRWIKREVPWPVVPELVPSRSYLNVPDEDVFIERFVAQLRSHGVPQIRETFDRLAVQNGADRLVLLCFEKLTKGEPCHRTYFRAWWTQQTGEAIDELGEQPTHEQLALDLGGAL